MTDQMGWTVIFEAAGEPGSVEADALDRLLDQLAPYSGSVSGTQDGSRYSATFSLEDFAAPQDHARALEHGEHVFRLAARMADLPDLPIVHVEALTFAEHDAQLAQPVIPELVSVSEIAKILGVSRQRAHQLTKREDFPAYIAKLDAGPIWTRPSLNLFLERWRADKPDVTAELAELDEELERLRRIRNQIAHGTATPDAALQFATTTAKAIHIVAGTVGAELKYEDIVNVGGAVIPDPARR